MLIHGRYPIREAPLAGIVPKVVYVADGTRKSLRPKRCCCRRYRLVGSFASAIANLKFSVVSWLVPGNYQNCCRPQWAILYGSGLTQLE